MRKVVVIGATGLLGRHIVQQLQGNSDVIEASYSASKEKVDIADPASLQQLFGRIGQVDAVVCTAGIAKFAPWDSATDDDWKFGLDHKLMGQVHVVRVGARYMNAGGSITLTSGVLAQHPMPGSAIVTTVNAAVEGFVRAAALELKGRVRINAVSPGWVAETLSAMGKDPSSGIPAAEVGKAFIRLIEGSETGQIVCAKRD